MMRQMLPASLVLCLAAAGCSDSAHVVGAADGVAAETATVTVDGWEVFGEKIAPTDALPLTTVIGDAQAYDGQRLRLVGTVDSVCKVKGCWMTLSSGDESMRVRFKDYGFFMPKDCEGREVMMDGVFEVKELSVDEARHYLEDAGKMDEAAAITAPVKEYSFTADGVLMKKV